MNSATETGLSRQDLGHLIVITLFCVLTRVPFWQNIIESNKDAHKYVTALELDERFDVPPPGHIGSILIPRFLRDLGVSVPHSFAIYNLLLTMLCGNYGYLIGRIFLPPLSSLMASMLLVTSSLLWYYSIPVNCYLVWPAVLLMLVYHGWRYWQDVCWKNISTLACVLGIGSILRPDMLAFGGPLFFGILVLGPRKVWQHWLCAMAIIGGCCAVWFFWTASLKGGVQPFLEWVSSKHEFHESFGIQKKGWIEGLLRNVGKYGIALLWTTHVACLILLFHVRQLLSIPFVHWRWVILFLLAIGPSLYFAWIIFMGNHGLLFPVLPVIYLLLAWVLCRHRAGIWMMFGLLIIQMCQFALLPMKEVRNQRDMILNVMFLKYSADGLHHAFLYNLADFAVEESLSNVWKQLRDPEPMPEPKAYVTEEERVRLRKAKLLPASVLKD